MKHDCVVQAARREEACSKRLSASFNEMGMDVGMIAALGVGARDSIGPGLDQMADGIGRYWFVAAVFRDPKDIAETIGQMRAGGLSGRICVMTNQAGDAGRKAVAVGDEAGVSVVTLDGCGAVSDGEIAHEPAGMRVLLESMDGRNDGDGDGDGDGASRPHVYTQLNEDVQEGAFVLLASVAGPDEQVVGARLLLKGNCECVLTHEIKRAAAT